MRQHTAWLVALIRTIPAAADQTFVSKAVNPTAPSALIPFPYWVIHPEDGTDAVTRFSGPTMTQNPRFTIHSVGETADQAAWAAEQVKAKLIVGGFGIVPTISGEHPRPVWYDVPTAIQINDSTTPAVCWHIAECGFESDLTF